MQQSASNATLARTPATTAVFAAVADISLTVRLSPEPPDVTMAVNGADGGIASMVGTTTWISGIFGDRETDG